MAEVKCSGCPRVLTDGDDVFSREIGRVAPDSVVMLPLFDEEDGGGVYCEGCARTVLNMTASEIARAKLALEAHLVRVGGDSNNGE